MIPRLVLRLLRLFAIGSIHATVVQELAAAAWSDGWGRDNELSEKLKKAGNHGRSKQHVYRAIISAARDAGLLAGMSQPYVVEVPGPGGSTNRINVYLPHEQLAHVVFGAPGGLASFCLTQNNWPPRLV